MENEKPKYQPWNEEEFQSDVFVRGMSAVQRWMYRSLLQAAFFHTTRPFLPNDDRILWVLAGCESRQQWLDNKSEILERFTPVEDRPELLENKRVTKDWNNLLDVREEMVTLGKRRAANAERTESGQFKPRLIVASGSSGKPAALASETSDAPASEVKVSEVKTSEGKLSEATSNTAGVSENFQPSEKSKGDWSNIRRPYRRVFNKKPDSARFKVKYEQACLEYGEDVVLACFESWSSSVGDTVKSFDNPLYSFFKKLPDLAVDEIESQQEEKEIAAQAEKEKQQRAKDAEAIEASIRRQREEDWRRMNAEPPPENGASVLEYLADLETNQPPADN